MAQIEDLLGRVVENTQPIAEMREFLRSLLKAPAPNKTVMPETKGPEEETPTDARRNEILGDIQKILERSEENFKEQMKEGQKAVDDTKALLEEIAAAKAAQGGDKPSTTNVTVVVPAAQPIEAGASGLTDKLLAGLLDIQKNMLRSTLDLNATSRSVEKTLAFLTKEATTQGSIWVKGTVTVLSPTIESGIRSVTEAIKSVKTAMASSPVAMPVPPVATPVPTPPAPAAATKPVTSLLGKLKAMIPAMIRPKAPAPPAPPKPPAPPGGVAPEGGGGKPVKVGVDLPDEKKGKKAADDIGAGFSKGIDDWRAEWKKMLLDPFNIMAKSWMEVQKAIFGGIEEELEYQKQIRAIAFQTQGVTRATEDLQRQFVDLGKTVGETGQNLTAMQQEYLKNLRKGNMSRKQALTMTKIGLNLETMIGAEGQGVSETLYDWSLHLRLSVNQSAQISREVQDVARWTGITGDKLAGAVKKATELAKVLDHAGTATAQSVANLIRLNAIAEKFNVGDAVNDLNSALTSSHTLFMKASPQVQNLLFGATAAVGKLGQLKQGIILQSREGMRDMAQGMEMMLSRFGVTLEEIENLDPERLMRLNLQLGEAYGMQANEIKKVIETYREASKGFGDRMWDINKELENGNLTAQERLKLERDRQQLVMGEGFRFLTMFDEAAKKGGDMASVMANMTGKMSTDIRKDLEQMGVSVTGDAKMMGQIFNLTTKKLKEAGSKVDFTPQIEEAMASGNVIKMREVLEKMNEEQRKLGVETAKKLDPMAEIAHTLNKINEYTRTLGGKMIMGIAALMGPLGIIAFHTGVMAAAMMPSGLFTSLFGKLGGMFKGGAGAAATGAGKAAANVGDGAIALAPAAAQQAIKSTAPTIAKTITPAVTNAATQNASAAITQSTIAASSTVAAKAAPAAAEQMSQALGKAPKGFKFPAMNIKGMGSFAAQLALGALALTAVAVGLVAMALVIIKVTDAILGIGGMDAEKAAKAALNIAALMGAMAVLMGAVTVNAALMTGVGYALTQVEFIAPALIAGALALAVLTPAMILMAVAIIKIADACAGLGVDFKTGLEVARKVGELIGVAALISGAVVAAAAGLTGVGMLYPYVGYMLLGAATLLLLTPAIIKLALAIINLANGLSKGFDPKYGAVVGKQVADILIAAGKITGAILLAGGALVGISLLSILTPFMYIGAVVLYGMTDGIIRLAQAIINLSDKLIKKLKMDPAAVAKTAKQVAVIFEAVGQITSAVTSYAGKLIGLGSMGLLGQIMSLGASQLESIIPKMKKLAIAVATMGAELREATGEMSGEDIVKSVQQMQKVLMAVTAVMSDLIDNVAPMAQSFLWWDSPLEDLEESIDPFVASFKNVGKMFRKLIEVIQSDFGTIRDMADLVPQIQGAGKVLMTVTAVMQDMIDKVTPMADSFLWFDSPLEDLDEAMPSFLSSFKKVGTLFKELLKVVQSSFGPIESVKEIVPVIEGAGKILMTITAVMTDMIEKVAHLADSYLWFDSPLEDLDKAVGPFLASFEKVGGLFKDIMMVVRENFAAAENAKEIVPIVQGAAQILSATAAMVTELADVIPALTDGFLWFYSPVEDLVEGMPAFLDAFEQVGTFFSGIIEVVQQNFTAGEAVKEILPIIQGAAQIIAATTSMVTTLADVIPGLTNGFLWFGSPVKDLKEGMPIFLAAFREVGTFFTNLVAVVQENFGAGEAAKEILPVIQGAASIIAATTNIITQLTQTIPPLTKSFLWSDSPIEDMKEGMPVFLDAFEEVGTFFTNLVDVVQQSFGAGEAVKEIVPMIQGVSQILTAVTDVMNVMTSAIVPLTQGSWFTDSPVENIREAINEFGNFFWAVGNFISTGIVKPIASTFGDAAGLKQVAESAKAMSVVLTSISDVMDTMLYAIVPLTEGSWFSDSPAERILEAKDEFGDFFWSVSSFIASGIIEPIAHSFGEAKDLAPVAETAKAMGVVLQSVAAMMDVLTYSIIPLVSGGWWFSAAPADKIKEYLPKFAAFFWATSGLLRDGIVLPIMMNFGEAKNLEPAAATANAMATVLTSVATVMDTLTKSIIPLTREGWWFKKSPVEKIYEGVIKFSSFFQAIAWFLRMGIVNPIQAYFGDAKELESAAASAQAMAKVIQAIPPMMDAMTPTLSVMTNKSWWSKKTPADKIREAIPLFEPFFLELSRFLRDGIITPIRAYLPNDQEVTSVAQSVVAMATILTEIPKMFAALDPVLRTVTHRDFWSRMTPAERMQKAMPPFKDFFFGLAQFLRDGVITPIRAYLPNDQEVTNVAQSVVAMSTILTEIPKMMAALDPVLSDISDRGSWWFPQRKKSERILKAAKEYQPFFLSLSQFMRDGIVTPIRAYLPNDQEVTSVAASVVAMAKILQEIPKMMTALEGTLSVVSDRGTRWFPKPAKSKRLLAAADEFQPFFFNLAQFLRDGVITPIRAYLPNDQEVTSVAESVVAMAKILEALPKVFDSIMTGLIPLMQADRWTGQVPAHRISAMMPVFNKWFMNISMLLRDGVITPIRAFFPNPQEIQTVAQQIAEMATIIENLSKFLNYVSTKLMIMLTGWWWGESSIVQTASRVSEFSAYFTGIAKGLGEGIIIPIRTTFPQPGELMTIIQQLDGMLQVLDILPVFLNLLSERMKQINEGWWWGLQFQVGSFSTFFSDIATALGMGIIEPIRQFPPAEEINTIVETLDAVSNVLMALPGFLANLATTMQQINQGWWWGMRWDTAVVTYWFGGLVTTINTGIIQPIIPLPSAEDITAQVSKLEALQNVLTLLPTVLDTLAKAMERMNRGWWWDQRWEVRRFGYWFRGMAEAIGGGILTPIRDGLPKTEEVQAAADKMQVLADVMDNLVHVFETLAEVMERFKSGEFEGIKGMADAINPMLEEVKALNLGAFDLNLPKEAMAIGTELKVAKTAFDASLEEGDQVTAAAAEGLKKIGVTASGVGGETAIKEATVAGAAEAADMSAVEEAEKMALELMEVEKLKVEEIVAEKLKIENVEATAPATAAVQTIPVAGSGVVPGSVYMQTPSIQGVIPPGPMAAQRAVQTAPAPTGPLSQALQQRDMIPQAVTPAPQQAVQAPQQVVQTPAGPMTQALQQRGMMPTAVAAPAQVQQNVVVPAPAPAAQAATAPTVPGVYGATTSAVEFAPATSVRLPVLAAPTAVSRAAASTQTNQYEQLIAGQHARNDQAVVNLQAGTVQRTAAMLGQPVPPAQQMAGTTPAPAPVRTWNDVAAMQATQDQGILLSQISANMVPSTATRGFAPQQGQPVSTQTSAYEQMIANHRAAKNQAVANLQAGTAQRTAAMLGQPLPAATPAAATTPAVPTPPAMPMASAATLANLQFQRPGTVNPGTQLYNAGTPTAVPTSTGGQPPLSNMLNPLAQAQRNMQVQQDVNNRARFDAAMTSARQQAALAASTQTNAYEQMIANQHTANNQAVTNLQNATAQKTAGILNQPLPVTAAQAVPPAAVQQAGNVTGQLTASLQGPNSPTRQIVSQAASTVATSLVNQASNMQSMDSVVTAQREVERTARETEQLGAKANSKLAQTVTNISKNARTGAFDSNHVVTDNMKITKTRSESFITRLWDTLTGISTQSNQLAEQANQTGQAVQQAQQAQQNLQQQVQQATQQQQVLQQQQQQQALNQTLQQTIQQGGDAQYAQLAQQGGQANQTPMSAGEEAIRQAGASYNYRPQANVDEATRQALLQKGYTEDGILAQLGHAQGPQATAPLASQLNPLAQAQRDIQVQTDVNNRAAFDTAIAQAQAQANMARPAGPVAPTAYEQIIANHRAAKNQAVANQRAANDQAVANLQARTAQKTAAMLGQAPTTTFPIPAHAEGGEFLVNNPRLIMVGEKGPERVNIVPQQMAAAATGQPLSSGAAVAKEKSERAALTAQTTSAIADATNMTADVQGSVCAIPPAITQVSQSVSAIPAIIQDIATQITEQIAAIPVQAEAPEAQVQNQAGQAAAAETAQTMGAEQQAANAAMADQRATQQATGRTRVNIPLAPVEVTPEEPALFGPRNVPAAGAVVTGQPVNPQLSEPVQARATSLVDEHERMQEQYASEQAGADVSGGNKDLAVIANLNERQLEMLSTIHDDLQELVALFQPSEASGDTGNMMAGSTRTQTLSPKNPSDYGNWQFGRYNGNANKNVLNPGT